ncbi:MAG TPA: glycosyltransferase family 39 protein, partial [Candidatus Tectomicrobia bacterium]|nr:glycosyltransferase family 39 protein [Candidatus Tectomicrobia bacterium]
MDRRPDRWDYACATALAALTVLSRLPFRARLLYNWDAVQFALALAEYDVAKHQPHPPGYILYVGLGRLAHACFGDATAAYVALSIAFSGLSTFVVYLLACAMYDRATAVAASIVLAVSPLSWFYGSVGLTYAAEAVLASIVAYFAHRALDGSESDAWLGAAYLGLAGGLRQSLLLLLFPLWLGAVLVGARRARTALVGLAILGVCVAAWFAPMVWLTGGLERYLDASHELAVLALKPTSVVTGAPETTLRMSRYLLESVVVALGPLAIAVALVPWYVRRGLWGRRESFLVGWTVAPVLVYTLVHFGQAGYVLTFLPALVILLTRVLLAALARAAERLPRLGRAAVAAGVVALVVLANGAFFVSARPLPRDFDTRAPVWRRTIEDDAFDWIFSRTAAALREHEAVVRTFVGAIREAHPPGDTVVITEVGNARSYPWLRHAMFYLPEYPVYGLLMGDGRIGYYVPNHTTTMTPIMDGVVPLPPGARRLVWFVDHWNPEAARPRGLVEIALPHGRYLYVLPLGRRPVRYAGYTL